MCAIRCPKMLRTTAGLLAAGAAAARGADPFNCTQQPANAFTAVRLTNNVPGMEIDVIPYGATLQRFLVPDAKGVPRDVILGFDDATLYCSATTAAGAAQHPYFGALIGRVANRIANGSFELNGATVHTPINEQYSHGPGGDTLHGGTVGFDRRVWDVLAYNGSSVTFGLLSRDGEMGFPGALAVAVTYTLTDAPRPAWDVAYEAHALTADTVVALSQHTYWNLGGFVGNTEDALATVLEMPTATAYVAVDDNLIPTGDVPPVSSAPWLDFTTAKAVGRDIANGTVAPGGGYDNAWVNPAWTPGAYADFATVSSPLTGISMVISTDQPSVQFYAGNFLDGSIPRKAAQCFNGVAPGPGCAYQHWSTTVFEAQHYPDSVHHDNFPSVVLRAGGTYTQHTRYTFTSL